MSTPIGTTEYTEQPKYLTPEYEVERNGETLHCQMMAYRGHIYEVCRSNTSLAERFKRLVPEPFVEPDDPGHEHITDHLAQSLSCSEELSAE